MSSQDRIQELCQQALRKGDWTDKCQEKFQIGEREFFDEETIVIATPQVRPTPQAPSQAKPAADRAEAAVSEEKPEEPQEDPELKALLEEREAKRSKRTKRARVLVNCLVLAVFVVPAGAVCASPTLRGKFDRLVVNLRKGVEDAKQIGNTKESYDAALEEIAGRGGQINSATEMLGVDPNSVDESDDLEMTAELRQFMGDEADGFKLRQGNLASMGKVATAVTGMEATLPKAEGQVADK